MTDQHIKEIQQRVSAFMRAEPWQGQSLPDAVKILDTEACAIAGMCDLLCINVQQLQAERTAWLQQVAAEHDTEPYHVAKHHHLQTTIEELEAECERLRKAAQFVMCTWQTGDVEELVMALGTLERELGAGQ